jgi:C-terminal processing protease CtpA/Prc
VYSDERSRTAGFSRANAKSRPLLANYLDVETAGNEQALVGRTAGGIGYLMVGSWSQQVDLDAVEKALAGLRDCKAMVVDARPNAGGDERLAQRIAAWFVEGTKVYAKNRYRIRAGKDGFGPVLDRAVTGNEDAQRRFAGPIAVLTSRYVMSSNESFVMMLQQARDCTLVGQPTYGSSGNPKAHDLGNGVTIVMPSWQDLRLDGSCLEGEGIAPDVLVEASAQQLETKDPILEKALAVLRDKVAK